MENLPNEIILEISRYLHREYVGHFSLVNRKLYNLLEAKREVEKFDFIRGFNMSASKFFECYCRLWLNKKRLIKKNDPLPDYIPIDPEFNFHFIRCYAVVDGLGYVKKYNLEFEWEIKSMFRSGDVVCNKCIFFEPNPEWKHRVFLIKRQGRPIRLNLPVL